MQFRLKLLRTNLLPFYRILSAGIVVLICVAANAQPISHLLKTASTFDTAGVNYLNHAAAGSVLTNLDSALRQAQQADSISEKINYPKGKADALVTLTSIYQNKGSYTLALQNGLAALQLYEQLNDISSQGATYLLLAMVYKDMSGNERTDTYNNTAISYSSQAYALYTSIADTAGIVNSLSLRGTLNRDRAIQQKENKFYDTAFQAFTQAIILIEKSGKGIEYTGKLYNNISQVYTEYKKDYQTALSYLFKAVVFNEKKNNTVSLSHNYGNISETYLSLNDYGQALIYARKMEQAAKYAGRPGRVVNALLQLYRVYYKSGRPDSALRYYMKASNLNDSLTDIAKTQQVTELQTRYETEKKELQIQHLNTENRIKNTRIVWLVAGLAIVAILAMGLIALYRRVQHQKILLAAQATRLEVMMKELHHRVKNNLQIVSSLLNMQTYKLHDEESINALKASGQRVQAMSLIHQRLYKKDELTAVNLREYITDLSESLLESYGYSHSNFDLQVTVEQELMDVDTAMPIGLIVNELITNAMKYAYRHVAHPALQVALTNNGSSICLTVKDNGEDFNEISWQQSKGSFGKQLITSLCRQLRAKQSVSVHQGTEFRIIIPQKAA